MNPISDERLAELIDAQGAAVKAAALFPRMFDNDPAEIEEVQRCYGDIHAALQELRERRAEEKQ